MVDPITPAAAIANITAMVPPYVDIMVTMGNWIFQNPAGMLVVTAFVVGYGFSKIMGIFRRKRRR